MSKTNPVRPSRDGDQFHYLWAARRCLKLLSPESDLVAVSVEGASPHEQSTVAPMEAGDELIDIAEYYGSEDFKSAGLVRYMQLKHSTLHVDDPWTASGLEHTIAGFAKRFAEIRKTNIDADITSKLEFWFVTNRPVQPYIIETVEDASHEAASRHPAELEKIKRFTELQGREFADFCKTLHFEDRQEGYWDQRNILFQDVSGYLPGADIDAPVQLKELVTRRALSESANSPVITKMDVLRALKTEELELFPAECLIEEIKNAVPREQEAELISKLLANQGPAIVHAAGGVGKSVFAKHVDSALPKNCVSILYDCFGNGQYRSTKGSRHRHKEALVQIANELASRGLCHLLIPASGADAGKYLRAFSYRLEQAITQLRAVDPASVLFIIVDAADNAQMAAEEIGEARSFARDLIRTDLPDGVHLVFLCRSHRQSLLDPPLGTTSIELKPFSRTETALFLRHAYPAATEHDVDEFHRLSSHNPRVQRLALSQALPLPETLRLLGPNPTTVEDAISSLLDQAIARLKDASAAPERDQVERICAGLAVLRPLIPINILSVISGVDQGAIKSFAYDIGSPLLVTGDSVQFRDEPAETWFRDKFKPVANKMADFIANVRPLSAQSAYAAAILPQLMLEAGQFSELVELALSSDGLPENSPLERRDVELNRLQFALKAALRSKQYLAAAKMAMKAGGETAADSRQKNLLQDNTDLVAKFLEIDQLEELVSRRTFGSDWTGSHNAYEAALLSGRTELLPDARSRLRMANEWLRNWARLQRKERKKEDVSIEDIAELTIAHLNIHGPEDAASSIRGWTPRDISYRAGRVVVKRLIDHGQYETACNLSFAAGSNIYLVLAAAAELREVNKSLPDTLIKKALRCLLRRSLRFTPTDHVGDEDLPLDSILAIVESALPNDLCSHEDAAKLLGRYLPLEPPHAFSSQFSTSRFPLLRAYCIRAALEGKPIELIDVAHKRLREEMEKSNQYSTSRDLQEFKDDIGILLPWYKLWAKILIERPPATRVLADIQNAYDSSFQKNSLHYREYLHAENKVAIIWMDIYVKSNLADSKHIIPFQDWKNKLKSPLFTPTLNLLSRICSQHEGLKGIALNCAAESFKLTKDERSDADSKSEYYIKIARSILATSDIEAKAYFFEALEISSKIGDENLAQWDAILYLADGASCMARPAPHIAYQFARCAEVTYDYVVRDKHFAWDNTIVALCGLCPSSAITILSRWRDRQFGWRERLLPIAIDNLIERGAVDPRDALPLIGFQASWEYDKLLSKTLDKCDNPEEKRLFSSVLYEYLKSSTQSSSELKKVNAVAARNIVTLDGLLETIAFEEGEETRIETENRRYSSSTSSDNGPDRDWEGIFSNKDLETVAGISDAYRAFKETATPWRHEEFFSHAITHLSAGQEANFIISVLHSNILSIYSFNDFLRQIPSSWSDRPAISRALAESITVFCRSNCLELKKDRYFELIPFDLIARLSGLSEAEIAESVLTAIGEIPDFIESSRLFSLIGLIVTKLSPDTALESLAFGLRLFDSVLEEKDGDGAWTPSLAPPADIRGSVAGYIWSGLAAPEAVLRWDATHAVLEVCRLGRSEVLTNLMKLAKQGQGGPFVDAKLPFYRLHGLQWLLIGLARASLDAPRTLVPWRDQLINWALDNSPHVLVKQFAARAVRTLIAAGEFNPESSILERLASVNKSPFPVVEASVYDRRNNLRSDITGEETQDDYHFGWDIGQYWYDPLARVFACTQQEIEAQALKVIRTQFGFAASHGWENDERGSRRMYQDLDTHHSHGSYPRADTFHFYQEYHALMIVAGQLLQTKPTYIDPRYDERDELNSWLLGHDLTRRDGRWLSDRRDPAPSTRSDWLSRGKDHPEHRVVTEQDFEEAFLANGQIRLWGYWTEADSRRQQTVHIHSALVSPKNSAALLLALSTVDDVFDYAVPSADSDMEIRNDEFEFTGWIVSEGLDRKLDRYDRWAGDITFPPPHPAAFISNLMGITPDADLRLWVDDRHREVIRTQVWGHFDEGRRSQSSNPNRGHLLQTDLPFLTSMLDKCGRDLIIEVQIQRQRRYQHYESDVKDDDERVERNTKIMLLDKHGRFRTLPGNSGTREKDC